MYVLYVDTEDGGSAVLGYLMSLSQLDLSAKDCFKKNEGYDELATRLQAAEDCI